MSDSTDRPIQRRGAGKTQIATVNRSATVNRDENLRTYATDEVSTRLLDILADAVLDGTVSTSEANRLFEGTMCTSEMSDLLSGTGRGLRAAIDTAVGKVAAEIATRRATFSARRDAVRPAVAAAASSVNRYDRDAAVATALDAAAWAGVDATTAGLIVRQHAAQHAVERAERAAHAAYAAAATVRAVGRGIAPGRDENGRTYAAYSDLTTFTRSGRRVTRDRGASARYVVGPHADRIHAENRPPRADEMDLARADFVQRHGRYLVLVLSSSRRPVYGPAF